MTGSFITNYFGFNRQQRNGLFVLVVISFTLLLVRLVYPHFIRPGTLVIKNLPVLEQKLDSSYRAGTASYTGYANEKSNARLFVFDPNAVSYEQLLTLGFREKTAKTFLKFRSRGFVFKQKKDLQKIYGISDAFYAKLEPYILINALAKTEQKAGTNTPEHNSSKNAAAAKQTAKLELNSADSLSLLALSGIGPSYAKRILKYRTVLGGYVSVEQLMEVYGFPEELFEKIKPLVTVNTALVKKINLNTDDFKTVNKHPYISYELTKVIFDWRRKTTLNAVNFKDILKDDALYNKLLPYLAFE